MDNTLQTYTIDDTASSLTFKSPFRKSWFTIFVLGWSVFLTFAICLFSFLNVLLPSKVNVSDVFVLPLSFVAFLFPAGILALFEWLWHIFGFEVATITNDEITIQHQIFGMGISKKLLVQSIDGVFISNQRNDWVTYMSREFKFFNFKKGLVAVNYGKTIWGGTRTYRFGSTLKREDAKQVVKLIHERFPQYKYHGEK